MSKKILLFLGLFTLLLSSCKKPPVACMELSTTNTPTGAPVEFSSCSERALSYEWFMEGPDGAPENTQGWSDEFFSHSFSVPGTYTITLNAYSDFSFTGEMSSTQETITIN